MSISNHTSKFYARSLTLLVHILKMISDGLTQTEIAKALKMKESHVSYYVRKAKENGYLNVVARDRINIYELTQAGKNLIDQYDNKMQYPQLPSCRAENVRFIARVHKFPTKSPDWHKVQMNNWTQHNSTVDNIKVHLNEGKNPTIEFLPSPIDGENPWELYGILSYDCTEAARKIEQTFDMEIGRLEMESRPEWVVYDPVAHAICRYNGQITIEGLGKINASKPSRRGAIEYFNPRFAAEYFSMPMRMSKIEKLLEKILEFLLNKEH